jgi:hypothetical protein
MPDQDEKDRLGDTLHKKERGEEERYFAEQDRIRLAKLRAQGAAGGLPAQADACPRCGRPLVAPGVRPGAGESCDGSCPQP